MLTSPWIYLAFAALSTLARELVRSRYRHRDIVCLLKMTQDPSSLRYLVQMEEARRPWPNTQRATRRNRATRSDRVTKAGPAG